MRLLIFSVICALTAVIVAPIYFYTKKSDWASNAMEWLLFPPSSFNWTKIMNFEFMYFLIYVHLWKIEQWLMCVVRNLRKTLICIVHSYLSPPRANDYMIMCTLALNHSKY
jgi:hypothetical protein